MRRLIAAAACVSALVTWASVPVTASPVPAAAGCNSRVAASWSPARQRPLKVEAFAHGGRCDQAVVMLVVRDADGAPLWTDSRVGAFVMLFSGVKTGREMQSALSSWIRQDHQLKSAANLPPWPVGAEQPSFGEFPFIPDEGVDRATYEAARNSRLPLFCYVQGMESMACVVLKDGDMTKFGVQLFPG
jgi:hypothetical protein